ncbi:MAG: hypothetical protein JW720_03460 [Sedimentisphaerales bacterium]|nr:hypothetical protein [Sedimentisphaerales bacterium]
MYRTLTITVVSAVLALAIGCSAIAPTANRTSRTESVVNAETTPHASLNYVYLVLDPQTIDAINDSAFIRSSFCRFGYSAAASTAASAAYLLGRDTCIEMLAAAETLTTTEGNAGVCFVTEEHGDIDVIYDNLRTKLGADVKRGSSIFNTGSANVRRFRFVSSHPINQTPPLLTWVTEPDAAFSRTVGFTTARIPANAAARQENQYPQPMFKNITSITLDLRQHEFDHLKTLLAAYGYAGKTAGNITVFSAPGLEIRAEVSANPKYRIRAIRCSLTRKPASPATMAFGPNASLTITEDAVALWTFGPNRTLYARN